MEILNKVFGNAARVRIMRLFILNPNQQFSVNEIVGRTMFREKDVRLELVTLVKIDLVHRRIAPRKEDPKSVRSKKTPVYVLNRKFVYFDELRQFLVNAKLIKNSELIKRISRVGRVKLIVLAGIFLNQLDDNGLDLLVVGDKIRRSSLERVVKSLESELGKEMKYAFFATADFAYRMNMYDKLIRDLLDYPHQVVFDRIGLQQTVL